MTLRSLGAQWHRVVAALPPIFARNYLKVAGAILKRAPDNLWKQRIVNSIHAADWRSPLAFSPQSIRLGDKVTARLTPHLNEFDGNALFFQQLPYEPEIFHWLEKRLTSYEAIVEIGANVGVFTVFMGVLARRAQAPIALFAFEPSRTAYQRLLQNLEANDLIEIVTPFNVALSDKTAFVQFYEPEGHLTNGSLDESFSRQFAERIQRRTVVTVNAAQLAELLQPYSRMLLKIDVEGAEPLVLAALQSVIEAKQPDIILEVLPNTEEALNALSFLKTNYILAHIVENGIVEMSDFVAGSHRDYWLTPTPKG